MSEPLNAHTLNEVSQIMDTYLKLSLDDYDSGYSRGEIEAARRKTMTLKADLPVITHGQRHVLPPGGINTFMTLHIPRNAEDNMPFATTSLVHNGNVVLAKTINPDGEITDLLDPALKGDTRHTETVGLVSGGYGKQKLLNAAEDYGLEVVEYKTAHEMLADMEWGLGGGVVFYPQRMSRPENSISTVAANAPWLGGVAVNPNLIIGAVGDPKNSPGVWDMSFMLGVEGNISRIVDISRAPLRINA